MSSESPESQPLWRELLHIAFPMIVSNACITVMVVTDRFFLSKLSESDMNASMGGGLFSFLLTTFLMGMVGYGTALVAQYLGAGRQEKCARVVTQGLILVAVGYPLILLISPIGLWIFENTGVDERQLGPQKVYYSIMVVGGLFPLLRAVFSGFFSGIGKTWIVMVSAVVSMMINVPLNACLIFGKLGFPQMGIRGAAYGTVLSSAVGVLVLAVAYMRRAKLGYGLKMSFRYDRKMMGQYFRFGSPAGFEFFLNFLAFNVMVMLLHAYSPVVATATTVVFNWDMVSFVPLIGMGVGVTSLVGRSMGAQDPERAHRVTMTGLKMGSVYSVLIAIFFVGFAEFLISLYAPSGEGDALFNEVLPLAVQMLRLASLYVLVEAVMVVYAGALRGAGDSFWAMVISVGGHWGVVVALSLCLYVFNIGPLNSWIVMVLSFAAFSGALWIRYRGGAWRDMQVVDAS